MRLARHPRLYLGPEEQLRLMRAPRMPLLRQAARKVLADAEVWAGLPPLGYARPTHNEHLGRAREVQTRVVALLAAWQRTGEARFRTAAIEHIRQMGTWEYWSWITWRQGDTRLQFQRYAGRLDQSILRLNDETAAERIRQRRAQDPKQDL